MTHVYYVHCTNGHDRVGTVSTGYVLAAYGGGFGFDLKTAYHYGMVGAFLPDELPADVAPDANFWNIKERRDPGTGGLKKEYLEVLQALACLYHPTGGVPPAPRLAAWLPKRPLWEAGYTFADPAGTPTVETPAHYVRVRPARPAP